tara:strand:- start:5593 stop:6366 length:774 start_codon:yes stop_codon:yes gene_type:complete
MSYPKIVFIVPYRNRENDKIHFEVYIKYLLEDYSPHEYEIYYSYQNDMRAFNRGAIKNIGFLAIRNKYPEHYKNITFVFNDIDILPIRKNLLNYETSNGIVKHYYGFDYALGGIFSITGEDFEKIKGFPNYWGWGYEDNVINNRCIENNIQIDRSNFYKIFNNNFVQTSVSNKKVINNQKPDINNSKNNNLNTISNLDYNIDGNIINVNKFDTIEDYNLAKFYEQDLKDNSKIVINKELHNQLQQKKNRLNMRNMRI